LENVQVARCERNYEKFEAIFVYISVDTERWILLRVPWLKKYVAFYGRRAKANPTTAFAYCQDDATGVVYLHGTGDKFANMDIDCDGDQSDPGDGRCGNSQDTQSTTAFQYQVQQYSGGSVSDLNANFIPYVVFGST
jgi:hypothetical protein